MTSWITLQPVSRAVYKYSLELRYDLQTSLPDKKNPKILEETVQTELSLTKINPCNFSCHTEEAGNTNFSSIILFKVMSRI